MSTPVEEYNEQAIFQAILEGPEGFQKNASAAGSTYTKRFLRENGFMRNIQPFQTATDADLTRLPNTDEPTIVEEMEALSPGAVSMAFDDTADTRHFRGDTYVVTFHKVSSAEFTRNVDELRVYKSPIKAITQDNSLKDVQTEEDQTYLNLINEVIGSGDVWNGGTDPAVLGDGGYLQNVTINEDATHGYFNRNNYVIALGQLTSRQLHNGVFLMNVNTAEQFIKFDRSEIGGDLSQDMFKKGLTALPSFEIMGIKHIATIKNWLVPKNVVYQFAPPDFMGKAYELQPITMYVKRERDLLSWVAFEKIGFTLANSAAVNRSRFAASHA